MTTEVGNLKNILADFDMSATLDAIFRPRVRVAPEVLESAARQAGEMTGVRMVRPIEDVLAEM